MKLIRVFPRITSATPMDENVRIGMPTLFSEADKVHISVTFSWDRKYAEQLYSNWSQVAPTEIGGVAYGTKGENFTPGMYLKKGCVITSRGCNNKCWFCSVWKRDGVVRELPITDGYNVMDDNLLACSDQHIMEVFKMLKAQPQKAKFTGGMEAKLLKPWHCEMLADLKPEYIYFAYDTEDDYEPLRSAALLMNEYGIMTGHRCMCYCLVGYPKDTFESATSRITQIVKLGFMPFAMLWRNESGETKREWRQFQRQWANPIITSENMKKIIK